MFSKLKTTILTVGIAAATLLGSVQAWALDIDYNTSGTGEFPIPGCDSDPGVPGGVWHLQRVILGGDIQRQFVVRAGSGSSGGPGGAVITIDAPNDIQLWGGERFGLDMGGGLVAVPVWDLLKRVNRNNNEQH